MVVIAANWKMNGNRKFTEEMVKAVRPVADKAKDNVKTILCPPFTYLSIAAEQANDSAISIGAQNMYIEEKGAYTGEISPVFLNDIGINYVIVGHSERRAYFNESSEFIAQKASVALQYGLTPILCIGEKLEDRELENTFVIIDSQLEPVAKLLKNNLKNIIIAYEPVWAIGTGRTATPEQAQEVHEYIRWSLKTVVGKEDSERVPILYGGSVKESNIASLIKEEDINGALIGGASLKKDEFCKIIEIAATREA